ncbi:MAG: rhodanese-like domain-containing protein [Pyrinomonadaceae bacterium]|jgi:adenylyltransferase/sulfurtransferase
MMITGEVVEDISAAELKELLDSGEAIQLIDVRDAGEFAFARIPGAKSIPLAELPGRIGELDPSRLTVIHCKMGGRSPKAIEILRKSGFPGQIRCLRGGITAWSNEIDPKVPKY